MSRHTRRILGVPILTNRFQLMRLHVFLMALAFSFLSQALQAAWTVSGGPAAITLNEDATNVDVSGTNPNRWAITDAGANDTSATVAVTNGTISLTTTAPLTLTNNGTSLVTITINGGSAANLQTVLRTMRYTPNANYFGADTIVVTLAPSGNNRSCNLTINPVNDAPTFTMGSDQTVLINSGATTIAGWATGFSPGPANEAAQTISAFILSNDNNALFSTQPAVAVNGTLTFTPAVGMTGTANVSVRVRDSGGTANGGVDTSAIQTFVISVIIINSVPSFTKGADQVVSEDAGPQTIAGWATAISPGPPADAGQSVDFIVSNNNNPLFSTQPAIAANGTLTFTPTPNANGTAVVSVQIHDDGGTALGGVDTSAVQTFVITVSAVNDPPVITLPAPQSVLRNTTLTLSTGNGNLVSLTDVDHGGADCKLTLTATNGTVKLSSLAGLTITSGSDGTSAVAFTGTVAALQAALDGLVFTPTANFTGAANLNLVFEDLGNTGSGGNQSDSKDMAISVTMPVNTTPPTGLSAVPLGGNVYVSWDPSVELPGTTVAQYHLYRSAIPNDPAPTFVATILAGPNPSFTDTWFSSPQYYQIADEDNFGSVSPRSADFAVVQAFPVFDGLASGADITFSWLKDRAEVNWAPPNVPFLGFRVAVGTTPGGQDVANWTDVGSTDHATIPTGTLASGTIYYTSVQMIDAAGEYSTLAVTDGFTVRGDRMLDDFDSVTCFRNARVANNIDFSDPLRVKPRVFSNAGGGFWRYRCKITVTEPGVTARVNAPCRVQFTVATALGSLNEIRVTDDRGNEVPRFNIGTSLTNLDFAFLVNMGVGETRDYWAYWGNPSATLNNYTRTLNTGLTSLGPPMSAAWTEYYSRKLLEPGLDPDTAYTNAFQRLGEDFDDFGGAAQDDRYSRAMTFPWNFFWFGTNVNTNWRVNSNACISQNNTTTDYSNTWTEFAGTTRWTAGVISPIWNDFMYNPANYPSPPPDSGAYWDYPTNGPARLIVTWRMNRFGVPDDTYIFQTVLYSTGDICHRYNLLSPKSVVGPAGTYDRPANTENTAGIARNDNATPANARWLTNTPLSFGVGNTPSSFFQNCDAYRGFYTVGAVEGAAAGYSGTAQFESMVFDSLAYSPQWATMSYQCTGNSGRLVLSARTGDTPLPELGGWSGWTNLVTTTTNGQTSITGLSKKRYIQYKCDFEQNVNGAVPVLDEVRFTLRGIEIESVVATATQVSQGQQGLQVCVKINNLHANAVSVTGLQLVFDLGNHTQSLFNPPALPIAIPVGGSAFATFTVGIDTNSPVGQVTIHASATAIDAGLGLTFSDQDANLPHSWRILTKSALSISQIYTEFTTVNKGFKWIKVNMFIDNLGEVPASFTGASLTFSLGTYTFKLDEPAPGSVQIPGLGSIIATFSVWVLSESPSGVAVIDGTASGTNVLTQALTSDSSATIQDSWTIQNIAELRIDSITASDTVYRGQSNIPIFMTITNTGEAKVAWTDTNFFPYFLVGSYTNFVPRSVFPQLIFGGLSAIASFTIDVTATSSVGLDDVDAEVSGIDQNSGSTVTDQYALAKHQWTILAEEVRTYKDASFNLPSPSFNRPTAGTVTVYAKGINLAPYKEFVVRWYDNSGTQVAFTNPPLTADDQGNLTHEYDLTSASPVGTWKVKITDPLDTFTSCQSDFLVVTNASITNTISLPPSVTVNQAFDAVISVNNPGGADLKQIELYPLVTAGTGNAAVTGPSSPSQILLIPGLSAGTFTYPLQALTPGTFLATAQSFGFDANSDLKLISASAGSGICQIQNPPAVSIVSVNAPTAIVYRNQQNLWISVQVRNTGSATAVITAASLTFTLGSHTQLLASPTLPFSLPGGSGIASFVYTISVASLSPTGLSNFSGNLSYYDANYPPWTGSVTGSTPNSSWNIQQVGIITSRNITYDPQQSAFNRGQVINVRAYGLTPNTQWFRITFWNYRLPQAATVPGTGYAYISSQLAADTDGFVDFQYTIPTNAALTDWTVSLDDDGPNTLLALQYFTVQTPGNLIASLTIRPSSVFSGEIVTATLKLSNYLPSSPASASTVAPATPSALVPTTAAAGTLIPLSGPTPASASIAAVSTATFEWTFQADQDTGLTGSYTLTAQLASQAFGLDANTLAATTAWKVISSPPLYIYKRGVQLGSDVIDFGSLNPGQSATVGNTRAINTNNFDLLSVRWNKTDLNGPDGEKISNANLSFSPDPIQSLLKGTSKFASASLFIPYNKASGTYIASMAIYNDLNGNENRDSDETFDLFVASVTVKESRQPMFVDKVLDLGIVRPGQETATGTVTIINIGNLPLTNLAWKMTAASAGISLHVADANPGPLAVAGVMIASFSAIGTLPYANYIATWTVWEDNPPLGSIDPGESSDTVQIKFACGDLRFLITPTPPAILNAGNATPTYVLSGVTINILNQGTHNLSALKLYPSDLSTGSYVIASSNLALSLSPTIAPGANANMSLNIYIPAGTPADTFVGTQLVYEDSNKNNKYDIGEATSTFILQVKVNPYPAVQVLVSTLDFGGVPPGLSKPVQIPCRNVGNATLTNLLWLNTPLIFGANTIPAASITYPQGMGFSVSPGATFSRTVTIDVSDPNQAFGTYLSVAPHFFLYDDIKVPLAAKTLDETQDDFKVQVQVGVQKIGIDEATLTSSGNPANNSSLFSFKIRNTGSLTLAYPKATASVLIPGVGTVAVIASSANLISPSVIPYILASNSSPCTWQVTVPAGASASSFAGTYVGTITAWEDTDLDGQIDPQEASCTRPLNLTVNAAKVLQVKLPVPPVIGYTTASSTLTLPIEIANVGNLAINRATFVASQIRNITNDPILSTAISMTPGPLGAIPIGGSVIGTLKVDAAPTLSDGLYRTWPNLLWTSGYQRVFEDEDADGIYDGSGEASVLFELQVGIGDKGLTVFGPVNFGSRAPNAAYSQNFTIRNTEDVSLVRVRCQSLTPLTSGADTFPIASLTFTPASLAIPGKTNSNVPLATLNIGPYQKPGTYVATCTAWEDDNNSSSYTPGEASATFNVEVTVQSKPGLNIVPTLVDIGAAPRGTWTASTPFLIQNTGNVTLSSLIWAFPKNPLTDYPTNSVSIPVASLFFGFPPSIDPGNSISAVVQIGPIGPLQAIETYLGTQTIGDAVYPAASDTFTLKCNIIPGGPPTGVSQEVATTTFNGSRFILSAWVCPGTGTAGIAFSAFKDAHQTAVATAGLTVTAGGLITQLPGTLGGLGAIAEMGVADSVTGRHPDYPTQTFTWYRLYVAFDATFNPGIASSCWMMLLNQSAAPGSAVWFDGVQLEKASIPDQTRPTAFSTGRKIYSPNSVPDISGDKRYYQW